MWKWVLRKIVEWAAANVTEEVIKEWAEKTLKVVVPWMRARLQEVFASLRAEAQKTETTIDDMAVDAAENFFEALLPDTPKHLK